MQPCDLALDVEKADLAKIERVSVELVPGVHITALHVVRQVIDVVKADTVRCGINVSEPLIFVL